MPRGRPRKVAAKVVSANNLVQQLRQSATALKGSNHAAAAAAGADRIQALETAIQLAIGALAAKL